MKCYSSRTNILLSLLTVMCLSVAFACSCSSKESASSNTDDGVTASDTETETEPEGEDDSVLSSETNQERDSDSAGEQNDASEDSSSQANSDEGDPNDTDSDTSSETDDAAESTVTLTQLYGSSTPVFLLAYDEHGVGIGFLAVKDPAGNPVRIKGIAIYDQTEVFRVEVDEQGRPVLFATPEEAQFISNYTESSATVTTQPRNGTSQVETITFEPADLEAVRLVPPSFDFVEKDADGSLLEEILDFGKRGVASLACNIQSTLTPDGDLASILTFRKALWNALKCHGDPNSQDWLFKLLGFASLAADAAGCAIGVGSLAALFLAGPAGSVVAASVVAGGAYTGIVLGCQSLIKTLAENSDGLDVDSIHVDGITWYEIPEVAQELITVSLHPSPKVVALGDYVDITAVVKGGVPPYEMAWVKNDEHLPEWENSLQMQDTPTVRTRYEFGVQDTSRSWDTFALAEVWVAVCGDGECSPEEDRVSCPEECTNCANGDTDSECDTDSDTDSDLSTDSDNNSISSSDDDTGQSSNIVFPEAKGVSWGDPHLVTLDGVSYDCQAHGELVLVQDETDGLEVQVRTVPWNSNPVTVNTAVAVRVGEDVFSFYRDGTTVRNSEFIELAEGIVELDAGKLRREGNIYDVAYMDGSVVRVVLRGGYIDVRVYPDESRIGQLRGLLGNFDGYAESELVIRDGEPLEMPPVFDTFYGQYVESWRVSQEESMFWYDEGESTETYTDRSFPRQLFNASRLDAASREAAETICQSTGVADAFLEACILDVGLTGDATFANAALDLPAPEVQLELLPSPRLLGLTPISTEVNSSITLTLTGDEFAPTAVVYVNDVVAPTVFVSTTTLEVAISAEITTAAGDLRIEVENIEGDARTRTSSLYLRVTPPVGAPIIYDYTPDNGLPGDTIKVIGSNLSELVEVRDAGGTTLITGTVGAISWPNAGSVSTIEVTLAADVISGPITVSNETGSFQGKVFNVGQNLTVLPGTTLASSSQYNATNWSRVSGADNNLATSFFTANGDCASSSACTTVPWYEVSFAEVQDVQRILLRGNREYSSGYDFLSGRFELLGDDATVLWTRSYDLPLPDRDIDIVLDSPIGGVRSVKFVSLADESIEPGFSELEVFAGSGTDSVQGTDTDTDTDSETDIISDTEDTDTGTDGQTSSEEGALDGIHISLICRNPADHPFSSLLEAVAGTDVEFPNVEDHQVSGANIIPVDIDILSDSIIFDYHPLGNTTFQNTTFNGYVLNFDLPEGMSIEGVQVQPESTEDVAAALIYFESDSVYIHVAGLSVGPDSYLALSLSFSPDASSPGPLDGHWQGTATQGTNSFGFEMDLIHKGNTIRGTSTISRNSDYGMLALTGTLDAATFTFFEQFVIEEEFSGNWCIKNVELTLTEGTPDMLEGEWSAPGCSPGSITVTRDE